MNFTKRSVLAVAALIALLSSCTSAVYAGDEHHYNSHGRSHGNGHGLFSRHNRAMSFGFGSRHGNGHNRRQQSNRWNTGHGQVHGHGHSGHGKHHGQ